MYILPSSAGAIAFNFSLAKYKRRWSTFWRGNIGTTAKKPGGWVVWNVWNIRNVQDIPNVWNIPFVILLKVFVQSVKLDKKCIICYTYNRRKGYHIF